MTVSEIQLFLNRAGFPCGRVDGEWGVLTQAAVDSYNRAHGSYSPVWLTVAEREFGVSRVLGPRHNVRILEYQHHTTLNASDDETPWCSSFMNFCVDVAGLAGTHSAAAASWLHWGRSTEYRYGAVAVFSRVGGNHVTLAVWVDVKHRQVYCLGGNQTAASKVCVSAEPLSRLIGYRWFGSR